MKRLQKTVAIMGMMALVLTGCSQGESKDKMENKDATAMEQSAEMMSEDNMKEGSMEGDAMKGDAMEGDAMEGDAMKEGSMEGDAMKGYTMKGDTMKGDTMKGDAMKGDAMKDKGMKDGVMHGDSMKDKEMEEKKMAKSEKRNDGEVAPDFSLKDMEGNTYTLSEQGGKKVYVKFWASWCSICLSGLEELNTLAGEDNDFEIVTVVAPGKNGEKSKEEFIKWFNTLGYSNIKVLFDETGDTIDTYMVRAYPTSAMVGTDGVLVSLAPGHLSSEQITKAFEQIK